MQPLGMGAQSSGAPAVLSAGRGMGGTNFGVEEMTSVAWGWPAVALPALLPWHGAREGWMEGHLLQQRDGKCLGMSLATILLWG